MTAPEPGPLADDAAEADVLEQLAPTDDDGHAEVFGGEVGDVEADPADVADQRWAVPLDDDRR
ncbi:hypothetical protein [Umezawaea sp.]|uniref:hypothetical protein n=1 Tax=Umezawaea sp. TaxID=1955258 RepID=UPI002ED49792